MARPDDLALLPRDVAAAATVEPNGEVQWPLDRAGDAINALADAGRVVLGLDVRDYDESGRFVEVAWTSYEPTGDEDIESARVAALNGLRRPDLPGDMVLITWR